MPVISVIVPVYNVETYLAQCIESILSQTFEDFELLLVDDGSKDRSGEICDVFAAGDTRIRAFHKENGGHVLDPTMLLEEKDYCTLLSGYPQPSEPGLSCYVLDKSSKIDSLIQELASVLNLNINQLNADVCNESIPFKDRIQPPVEHWLSGIRNSHFVLTDSFHACVFSIIFHRQFAVILNEARGTSRIHSLLKMFKLENRIITLQDDSDNASVIKQIQDMRAIDYNEVDRLLKENKEKSVAFLEDALK